MFLPGIRTQFEHIAQHGDLFPTARIGTGKVFERKFHAARIGIVGIHHDDVLSALHPLRTVVVRHVRSDGPGDVLWRDAEVQSHGDGCTSIGKVVLPAQRGGKLRGGKTARHPRKRREHLDGYVGLTALRREGIAADTLAALHLQRIVRPDKGHPVVFPQEIVQFGLGPDHAFHSAESLQVRAAEIGDVAIIRTGNGAQIADLVRMGSPHFHYGKLVAGAQREQREGNADVVVQVTLRGTHFKAAGKHPTQELLGRGLAIAAGQAQNRDAHLHPVQGCGLLKGGENILHDDHLFSVRITAGIVGNHSGSSCLQSKGDKVVPIEIFTLEGKKDVARGDLPRVGCYPKSVFAENPVDLFDLIVHRFP